MESDLNGLRNETELILPGQMGLYAPEDSICTPHFFHSGAGRP